MKKTIAFFGHREIYKQEIIKIKLMEILEEKVLQGYTNFLIGKHGDFDKIALKCCLELKSNNNNINIIIVLTTLSLLKKDKFGFCDLDYYVNKGCQTMIYDIEEEYFKNRIIFSNKKMVDDSDLIICYVDLNKKSSGAKKAVEYAEKRGKEIINLHKEDKGFYPWFKKLIEKNLG